MFDKAKTDLFIKQVMEKRPMKRPVPPPENVVAIDASGTKGRTISSISPTTMPWPVLGKRRPGTISRNVMEVT